MNRNNFKEAVVAALFLTAFLVLIVSLEGKIRTVETYPDKMQNVRLKIGRSTILKFREKPLEVVLGDKGRFAVDFVGNDIILQPRAAAKTNLFVYVKNRTFGFILTAGRGSRYDDLVNVGAKRDPPAGSGKPLREFARFKNGVVCVLNKVFRTGKGLSVLDFELVNAGERVVKEKQIDIRLSNVAGQMVVLSGSKLNPGATVKGRAFFKPEKTGRAVFKIRIEGEVKTVSF